MRDYVVILAIGATLGLAGCATSTAPVANSSQAQVGTQATEKGEQSFITGSRLPDKPPRDRTLKNVDAQGYKESQTSVLGVQPRN